MSIEPQSIELASIEPSGESWTFKFEVALRGCVACEVQIQLDVRQIDGLDAALPQAYDGLSKELKTLAEEAEQRATEIRAEERPY